MPLVYKVVAINLFNLIIFYLSSKWDFRCLDFMDDSNTCKFIIKDLLRGANGFK